MIKRPSFIAIACALVFVIGGGSSSAQVVINEFSAAQSDRLLQKPPGGLPKLGALPAWHERGFSVPSWWNTGAGPFGFGYTQTTNLQSAMQNKTPVVYLRRDFSLSAAQAGSNQPLELVINYDDGFVAYLNGVEVARRNTGAVGSFAWHDQVAFNVKTASGNETIALGTASGLLREGANVFAIQVHNNSVSDSRLLCSATLRIGGTAQSNLVVPGDSWRWFAGTHEPAGGLYDAGDFTGSFSLGPNWTQLEYADSSWSQGPGGFGFDTDPDYLPQIGTNLASMLNSTVAVYLRREFTISAAEYEALSSTSMTVDWDDGYVLYLNGYEISRRNVAGAPGTFVPFNQSASNHGASREGGGNNPAAILSVPVPKNLLRPGRNVLSAQLHNNGAGSSDLLLDVRFSGTSGASTLTFVTLGSPWRYRVATSEIGVPPPPNSDLLAPEFLDWVEMKNVGPNAVDIGGWTLTDKASVPDRWRFPAGTTIPAGGFLVVACSGRDVTAPMGAGLLHTNFSLGSKGEYLALHDAGGGLQSAVSNVPEQNAFHTWGRDPGDGQFRFLAAGTPGAENVPSTVSGLTAEVNFDKPSGFHASPLSVALSTATPGATIRYTTDGTDPTESTGTVYTGPFNPTVRVNVGPGAGTILREMFQWSPGTIVKPANLPANATPTTSQLITSFETPSNVSDNYTHRVRGFLHPPQTGNYEFYIATDDDGELWLSTNENPANKQRIAYIESNWASPRQWTKFPSQKSVLIPLVAGNRYYIEALQSEGGGGDNCAVAWVGPGVPFNVIEGRYLSPPATLPPDTTFPNGYAAVRARAFSPGRLPSEVRTRSYVTGADPRLATVPAFFLSGPPADSFYSPNGIFAQVGGNWNSGGWAANDPRNDYNFCLVSGRPFERPVTMEIINPGNQVVERSTIGARFAGSPWSRPQYQLQNVETNQWNTGAHGKPQLNLFFRGDLGISKLKKNGFIPTSKLNTWDELRLRSGKNDPYNPFIIDEWMRRTFAATGAPSPQGFVATLFINGHFKGYFNPTERVREPFFQEFYKSDNPWDINYIGSWEGGDAVAYNQMRSFFLNNDFTSLANYQQGATFWDMKNVADYFIVNAWAATADWPHNNYAFARERAPGAKWVFSMWDAEGAMGSFGQSNQHNSFNETLLVPENGTRNPTINSDGVMTRLVFRRAFQSAEFRMLFADRLQANFFNGGPMARANMQARWDSLRADVEPLIAGTGGGTFNASHWNNWSSRDSIFFQQCRSIGLWPATLAPVMAPFGGTVGAGATVTLTNNNSGGTVYYTTNGTDPRGFGGTLQGTAYSAPISVTSPLTIKARIRSNTNEWSPLVAADFAPPPQRVLITEINYNPPGSDDLTEFVELTNVSTQPAPLNGARFTEGIDFTFGDVTLPPGGRFVVVRDAAAFAAAYPGVTIGGVFSGALANDGETLTLRDMAGNIIVTVTYGDSNVAGWPADADGDGYTLVLKNPFSASTNPLLAGSWRASGRQGGAPGASSSTTFSGDPLADADRDGHNGLMEYALGTSDQNAGSLPRLTTARNPAGQLVISFSRAAEADDVTVEALESSDGGTWAPAVLESETPEGDGKVRSVWRSNGIGPRVFLRVRARMEN